MATVEKGVIWQFVTCRLVMATLSRSSCWHRRTRRRSDSRVSDEGEQRCDQRDGRDPGTLDRRTHSPSMGLPGGRMKQKYTTIPMDGCLGPAPRSRCFVSIVNSQVWKAITGDSPPASPPSAKDYPKPGYHGSTTITDARCSRVHRADEQRASTSWAGGSHSYRRTDLLEVQQIIHLRRSNQIRFAKVRKLRMPDLPETMRDDARTEKLISYIHTSSARVTRTSAPRHTEI